MVNMGKKKDSNNNSSLRGLLAPFRVGPPGASTSAVTPITSYASRFTSSRSHQRLTTPSAPRPYESPNEIICIPAGTPGRDGQLGSLDVMPGLNGSPFSLVGGLGYMTPPPVRGRPDSLEMDSMSTINTQLRLPGVTSAMVSGWKQSPMTLRPSAVQSETSGVNPHLQHLVDVPIVSSSPPQVRPTQTGFSDTRPTDSSSLPFGTKRDRELSRSPSVNVGTSTPSQQPHQDQGPVDMTKTTSLSRIGSMFGLNKKVRVKKETRGAGIGTSHHSYQTWVTPGTTRHYHYQVIPSPIANPWSGNELSTPPPPPPPPLPAQRQHSHTSLPPSRATRARFVGEAPTERGSIGRNGSSTRAMENIQLNTLDTTDIPAAATTPPITDSHLDDQPACSAYPVLQPTPITPASVAPSATANAAEDVISESPSIKSNHRSCSSDVQQPLILVPDLPSASRLDPLSQQNGSDSESTSILVNIPVNSIPHIPTSSIPYREPPSHQGQLPKSPPLVLSASPPVTPVSRLGRAAARVLKVLTPPSPMARGLSDMPGLQATSITLLARPSPRRRVSPSDHTTPLALEFPVPPSRPSRAVFDPFSPFISRTPKAAGYLNSTHQTPLYLSPEHARPDVSPLDPHGVLPSWLPSPGPQTMPISFTDDSSTEVDPDTSIETEDEHGLRHRKSMRAMEAAHGRMRTISGDSETSESQSIAPTDHSQSSFGHSASLCNVYLGDSESGPVSVTNSTRASTELDPLDLTVRPVSRDGIPDFCSQFLPPTLADTEAVESVVNAEVPIDSTSTALTPETAGSTPHVNQIDRLKSRLISTELPQTPTARHNHHRTPSSRLREMSVSDPDGIRTSPERQAESSRVYAILSSAQRDRDTDKVIEALHENARQAIQSPIKRHRQLTGPHSASITRSSRPSTPASSRASSYNTVARPRKLTFSSTTTDIPIVMTPGDIRVAKRIVSPWRDRVGHALKKKEEQEGPLRHGPRPSMAGSAEWMPVSTEESVDQTPVPVPPFQDQRGSLGVIRPVPSGISPKTRTRFAINDFTPSKASAGPSSSSVNHPVNSTISPPLSLMRKVSPGIMSRANALLDRNAESSSSGQSLASRRVVSPAMTTAPTSLEPSDEEAGPLSPTPCRTQVADQSTSLGTANACSESVQERELAELKQALKRNEVVVLALINKLRGRMNEEDELQAESEDVADHHQHQHRTPRSRISSTRSTPRDNTARVAVAIDVELQVNNTHSRSPMTSTPIQSRSVSRPSSLRRRATVNRHMAEETDDRVPTTPRNRLPRSRATAGARTGSPTQSYREWVSVTGGR